MEKNENTPPSSVDPFPTLNGENFKNWLVSKGLKFKEKKRKESWNILEDNFGEELGKVY